MSCIYTAWRGLAALLILGMGQCEGLRSGMGEKLDYPCLFYFQQFSINQPKLWVDRLKIKLAINMKQKGLLVVLLIFGFTTLFNKVVANPVTRQQAQKNVQAFLDKKGKKMEVAITDNEPSKGEESEYYYVFNIGKSDGYVIASADDCVPAILGYSDKGDLFQGAMPDNMKEWLQEYEDQIVYMREHGLSSSDIQSSTHPAISPLLTTTWGQGNPYNQSCPNYSTLGKCVTGCVATAMAQVMYYHRANSVRQTTEEIPSFIVNSNVSVDAFPAGSVIDWDNMLDSYTGSSTATQQQAVANLMAYCGASVKMGYGYSSSGAYSEDVPIALKRFFDYSEHTTLVYRFNYSDDKWDNLIYNELSKGNPIYYSGRNSSAGHAFVCDGYDGDGYYHINWGWTGTSDGYFLLSVLDPKDQGIGGSSSGYNQNQAALIGAIPNGEVVRLTTQALTISGNSTFSVGQNSNVNLSISITLKNSTGSSHNFSAAIGLYSKGAFVEVINEIGSSTSYSSGKEISQNATLSVRTNLANGAYQLIPISKETGTDKWNINENSSEKYLTLVVKDGTMSFYVGQPSVTTEVISFADSEVKRLCIENWDTDGDGELSYDEAAAVTSVDNVFSKSSITSFDELKYFTGITSLSSSFSKCTSLQFITLPISLRNIYNSSFLDCISLSAVNIPEGVTNIGGTAFLRCSSLLSVSIPASVTTIGLNSFGGCTNLNNFEVASTNSNYCSVDGVLFTKDRKTLVQFPAKREGTYCIPSGTEIIADYAFYMTNLSKIEFPNTLTTIRSYAFMYMYSLTDITIPNSVTILENSLFYGCSKLETASLPENITAIPISLFYDCYKLSSIILPPDIISIGASSFAGCWALKEVEIPSKVTSIGNYAFSNSGLKKVWCLMQTPCSIASTVFNGINNAVLYVPAGCLSAYTSADNWKNFSQILEIGGDQPYAVFNEGTLTFYNDNNRDTREGTTYDLNVGSNRPGWYDNRSSITKVVFDNSFSTALPVTTYDWFYGCSNLTEIQGLENMNTANITNMLYMFYGCSSLTNITLPTNQSRIYDHQFYNCSKLSTITIPNTVTAIDSYAFANCSSLQTITLPNVLESIGTRAFQGCRGINTIEIPTSVTSIGDAAFGSCTNVNDFVVNSGNSNYCTIEGVLYTKDRKTLVQYPAKRGGSYTIPSNTEKIGNGAFYGSKISSVSIPSSVVSLDNYAFCYCGSLTSLTIPNNVTSIGNYAFMGCYGMNEIALPEHITSIENYSFAYCSSLAQIEIPSEVTSIGNYAFSSCSQLQTVKSLIEAPFEINDKVFPTDVYTNAKLIVPVGTSSAYQSTNGWKNFTQILEIGGEGDEPYAVFNDETLIFYNDNNRDTREGTTYDLNVGSNRPGWYDNRSSITKVVFDDSFSTALPVTTYMWFYGCSNLTEIQGLENMNTANITNMRSMFEYCSKLTNITLPTNLSKIYDNQFYSCSKLSTITIPNTVTSIGSFAFCGCASLQTVNFPNVLETIGNSAFSSCYLLSSIEIPASVTSIGDNAFGVCTNVNDFVVNSDNSNYCVIDGVLYTKDQKTLVQYPAKREGSYTIPSNTEKIGNGAFYGSKISSVSIPLSVTFVDHFAFACCNNLREINLPTSLSSIGDYLLFGCSNLTNIILPEHITSIGNSAFSDCTSLAQIEIPSEVTSIGHSAFSYCTSLTQIEIPSGVTSIRGNAFFGCSQLQTVKSLIETPFEINENVFPIDVYTNAKLTVPSGTKAKYQSTSYWNKFTNIEEYTPTKRTIHVATAGTLPNLISESEKYIIEELTLTGELNGTDFRLLRDMAGCNYLGEETAGKLTVLDFSGARIVAGGEKYVDTNSLSGWKGSFRYTIDNYDILPQHVFHGCKFISVKISNCVTSIGYNAFSGCSGLTSIVIPSSVTSIGYWAFSESGLTSIVIPSFVTNIGVSVFSNCSDLTHIEVESGNKNYDSRNSCNAIIETSFNTLVAGCKNTTIPNSVTSIGNQAFYGCSGMTSITIPSSVTSIGNSAFSFCSDLISITIPSSVTSIGNGAFQECQGLTSITIPRTVTSIGDHAFSGCYQLQTVKSLIETPFEINDDVFPSTVYTNATLTIPVGTSSAYQTTNGWKNFTQIAEVDYTKEVEFTIDDELWVNCAESYSGRVTWSQIEFHLLDETLEGLSKNDFDNNYVLDYYNQSTRQIDINNETFHKVTCYGIQYNAKCGKRIDESRTFGTVVEEWNVSAQGIEDTTTHIIKWEFTFQELDAKARELRDIGKLEDWGDYYANRDPLVTWVRYAHLPYTPFTDTPAIGAAPEKGNPSIWVKLTIPAGAIRVAKGDMGANKNLTFWYDLNSKTNATSTKDAYEVRVNVPVPVPETSATVKTIGYSYTGDPLDIRYDNLLEKANDPLAKRSNKVYTEFTKDLKDFFIDGKLSASIKDDQHFGSIKGLKLGCEFILPSTNYGNASFNAGKNHNVNDSWTVKGYTGAEYTLILSADHTKIQIKAKDNTVYSEPVDLVTLNYDNNPVVADRQMTVLNYVNGVNQDDILNAYSHNELGEREAFTAYIVIRDVNACAPVVFDNRWFNVRFIRPLSVPNPKDDVIEDAPNDWQSISIMNYASVIDWRNYMGDPNNGNEGMDANNIFDFKYYGVTLSTNIAGILTDANLAIGERNDNFTKGSQININMDAAYMAKLQNISTIPNFQLEQVDGQTIKYKNNSGINGGFHIFVPVYMEYVFGTQTTPQVQYITIGVSNTPDIPETKQLYINDVSAYRGTQVTLPIQLDNEETLSGFQFDLELPEGIEFVKIEKTERLEDFSLSCSNISDNKYTIISFSMDGDEISTGNGTIVNLKVNIPSDYTAGDYITTMSNIKLMYGQTKTLLDDVTSILRVMACKPGDSDGDDVVDVADVVTTVNYILKRNPAKFVFESADIDKDNVIDVADVVGTVNIILKKNTTNYVRMRATEIVEDNDILSLLCNDDSYSLCLDNQGRYVAAQFDIRLVEGNVLESVRLNKNRMNGHQVTYNQVDENVYRVLIYSVGDGTFKGDEGELVSIQTSNGSFIDIENIKFITIHQKTKEFDALHSGVNSINTTSQVPCIDIYTTDGRLVRKHATTLEGLNKGIYIINNKKIIVK